MYMYVDMAFTCTWTALLITKEISCTQMYVHMLHCHHHPPAKMMFSGGQKIEKFYTMTMGFGGGGGGGGRGGVEEQA